MSVGSADLMKAINSVWDASTLDATFKALWAAGVDPDEFPVLHDQEATPEQPFPYVVMEPFTPLTTDRMSYAGAFNREIRDVDVRFNVHARAIDGDPRTSKGIAAHLVEEVMKVFGGHPTAHPTGNVVMDNLEHLITQYMNDFCIRTGDDESQWVLAYNFRIDVPVAY